MTEAPVSSAAQSARGGDGDAVEQAGVEPAQRDRVGKLGEAALRRLEPAGDQPQRGAEQDRAEARRHVEQVEADRQKGVDEAQGGEGEHARRVLAKQHALMNRHRAEDGERRQPPVVAARKDLVDEDEPAARQHERRRQRQRQDEPGKLLLVQRRDQHDQQRIADAEGDDDPHDATHAAPEHADVGADAGEDEDRAEVDEERPCNLAAAAFGAAVEIRVGSRYTAATSAGEMSWARINLGDLAERAGLVMDRAGAEQRRGQRPAPPAAGEDDQHDQQQEPGHGSTQPTKRTALP